MAPRALDTFLWVVGVLSKLVENIYTRFRSRCLTTCLRIVLVRGTYLYLERLARCVFSMRYRRATFTR